MRRQCNDRRVYSGADASPCVGGYVYDRCGIDRSGGARDAHCVARFPDRGLADGDGGFLPVHWQGEQGDPPFLDPADVVPGAAAGYLAALSGYGRSVVEHAGGRYGFDDIGCVPVAPTDPAVP